MNRPILFFDLETTGVSVTEDRIIQIATCKIMPDGTREVKKRLINPGIPIPAGATEVHKITDEMVKDAPTFAKVAKGLFQYFQGCDLAGFNSNAFDIPLLYNELDRCGYTLDYLSVNLIDVGNLAKTLNPRTLSATYKIYTGEDLVDAHDAEVDILATVRVFEEMVKKHEELPADPKELAKFSNYGKDILDLSGKFVTSESGDILINFGQHKGKPAKDHPDFLRWMLGPKAQFSKDTLVIAAAILAI